MPELPISVSVYTALILLKQTRQTFSLLSSRLAATALPTSTPNFLSNAFELLGDGPICGQHRRSDRVHPAESADHCTS